MNSISNLNLKKFQDDIVKEVAISEREQLDRVRDNETKMTDTLAQLEQERKEFERQEKESAIVQKESALAKLRSTAAFMKQSGMPVTDISDLTGLSADEIQNL